MGRKRKDDSQGLPRRVYLRRGTFYYAHPGGKWENLGRDLAEARRRAEHFNDATGIYGTMAWFLDQFLLDFEALVAAKKRSQRTLDDYEECIGKTGEPGPLRAAFGSLLPSSVTPAHVAQYLEVGQADSRSRRANLERACLSSCMSWMLRTGQGGITTNPCMRAAGVRRNPEKPRERYVTDEEYSAVYAEASASVRLMMELVYRTLQRPEVDVIAWTRANVRAKGQGAAGEKVLRFVQSKTRRQIDIALVGRLAELIPEAKGDVLTLHQPIVHTLQGNGYTYDGISAILKRAIGRVNKARAKAGQEPIASFGFRDLKGKGATDMWLAGVPIERIQLLCGHASKATTERYIKARWRETAMPNHLEIGR